MLAITGQSVIFGATISSFLRSISQELETVGTRITTGNRVNSFSDDPAAYTRARVLNNNADVLRSTIHNDLDEGIGIFQTAVTAMDEITEYYDQLSDLAADAASATPSAPLAELQVQFNLVRANIQKVIDGAIYNGVKVLSGTYDASGGGQDINLMYSLDPNQTLTLRVRRTTTALLSLDALNISTQAGAQTAYTSLNSTSTGALYALNYRKGRYSAYLDMVQRKHDYIEVQAQNLESAATSLVETDTAYETAKQSALEIRKQAAYAVLAQSNLSATYVLNLFPNITNWNS